jgi:hypothetical protein
MAKVERVLAGEELQKVIDEFDEEELRIQEMDLKYIARHREQLRKEIEVSHAVGGLDDDEDQEGDFDDDFDFDSDDDEDDEEDNDDDDNSDDDYDEDKLDIMQLKTTEDEPVKAVKTEKKELKPTSNAKTDKKEPSAGGAKPIVDAVKAAEQLKADIAPKAEDSSKSTPAKRPSRKFKATTATEKKKSVVASKKEDESVTKAASASSSTAKAEAPKAAKVDSAKATKPKAKDNASNKKPKPSIPKSV